MNKFYLSGSEFTFRGAHCLPAGVAISNQVALHLSFRSVETRTGRYTLEVHGLAID